MREDGSGTNTYNIEAISSSDTDDDDHAYSHIAQPPPPVPPDEEDDAHILQPPVERVPANEYRPLTPSYHPIYPIESVEANAVPYSPEFRPDSQINNRNDVEDAEMEEFSDMEALSTDNDSSSSSSSSSNSSSSNSMNNDEPLAGFSPNLEPVDAVWSSSSNSSSTSNSESNSDSDVVVPNVIEVEDQDTIW